MELIKHTIFELPSLGANGLLLIEFENNNNLNFLDNKIYHWMTGTWTAEGWEINHSLSKYPFKVIEWYELPVRTKSVPREIDEFWEEERKR